MHPLRYRSAQYRRDRISYLRRIGPWRDGHGTRKLSSLLVVTALMALLLAACNRVPPPLLGSLEWDRVSVHAEAAEPVLRWHVAEGDRVSAGDVLLELDGERAELRIVQARAGHTQARARLDELLDGARVETVQAARAELARARAAQTEAEREFLRVQEMHERRLIAAAALDQARAGHEQRRAESAAADARLRELLAGSRPEQVEQAAAALEAAQSELEQRVLDRERLRVRAPRSGRVDALPFKPGDQPPAGAIVVSVLVGEAPYARLFVPASRRSGLGIGSRLRIRVEGEPEPYPGRIRSIAGEASFTPYYALAGDDASRLVYRTEVVLESERAGRLPAGLPVQAEPADE